MKLGKLLLKFGVPFYLRLRVLNLLPKHILIISGAIVEGHGNVLQHSRLSFIFFNLYTAKLHEFQGDKLIIFDYFLNTSAAVSFDKTVKIPPILFYNSCVQLSLPLNQSSVMYFA